MGRILRQGQGGSQRRKTLFPLVLAGLGVIALVWILSNGPKDSDTQRPAAILPDIPDLAAMGTLPSLSAAMTKNRELRKRVKAFAGQDEAYYFFNDRQANRDFAKILFLWSGYTRDSGYAPEEYFLRRVYDLPPGESIKNNPFMGERPWPRLFNRLKARFLVQTAGGRMVFDGNVSYDPAEDDLNVDATLSENFLTAFAGALKMHANPRPFMINLLVYIDEIKALKTLSPEEKDLVDYVRSIPGTE